MIIGLSGSIGAGKDTVANMLVKQHGFTKVSFAGVLKDTVAIMFGWERHLLEGDTEESRFFREYPDPWWSKKFGYEVTPRLILQKFGTEVCRDNLHRDIWVHCLERKIEHIPNVVITDVRFPNELLYIQHKKGVTVKIIRGKQPTREEIKNLHESERAIANFRFDRVLDNNGTIPELNNNLNILLSSIGFYGTVDVSDTIFHHPV